MTFSVSLSPVRGVRLLRNTDGMLEPLSSWQDRDSLNLKYLRRLVNEANVGGKAGTAALAKLNAMFPQPPPVHKEVRPEIHNPHYVDFNTCLEQVKTEHAWLVEAGKDPFKGWPSKAEAMILAEAERRFIEWQKRNRKLKTWYEVLKIPHKGVSHEIKRVRRFRDWRKAEAYAQNRNFKARGAASFMVQTRHGVVPVKSGNGLIGAVQPNPKEHVMAKAKAKGKKAKIAVPKVRKDKAYYLKCLSGALPKTSGDYIRGRILQGKMSAKDIATEVRKKFKGHTTKPSDVYWNRGRLKADGVKVPEAVGARE